MYVIIYFLLNFLYILLKSPSVTAAAVIETGQQIRARKHTLRAEPISSIANTHIQGELDSEIYAL